MRRDWTTTALMCGLSFLAGVCLMDAQSRRAIEALAADNANMARLIPMAKIMSTADPRWVKPWTQAQRMRAQ